MLELVGKMFEMRKSVAPCRCFPFCCSIKKNESFADFHTKQPCLEVYIFDVHEPIELKF